MDSRAFLRQLVQYSLLGGNKLAALGQVLSDFTLKVLSSPYGYQAETILLLFKIGPFLVQIPYELCGRSAGSRLFPISMFGFKGHIFSYGRAPVRFSLCQECQEKGAVYARLLKRVGSRCRG